MSDKVRMIGEGATSFALLDHQEIRTRADGTIDVPVQHVELAKSHGFRMLEDDSTGTRDASTAQTVGGGAIAGVPHSRTAMLLEEALGEIDRLRGNERTTSEELDGLRAQVRDLSDKLADVEANKLAAIDDLKKVDAVDAAAPATEADFAEKADRDQLAEEGKARYDEARDAGMTHADAMELVAEFRAAPLGG